MPYEISFVPEVRQRLDEHYGGPEWADRLVRHVAGVSAVDLSKMTPIEGRQGFRRDPYGGTWNWTALPFHIDKPALTEPSFDGFTWPEPEAFFEPDERIAAGRETLAAHRGQRYLIAHMGWGLFESSWGIMGFENALAAAAGDEDFYAELLDRLTEQYLVLLEHTLATFPDVDAVMFGDDWGDQRGVILGPDRWRRLLKPRWAKLYERVKAKGKTVISHCCGSVVDILDDVVEIGLDVLESCQPEAAGMNPYELKRRWGSKLCFYGGLGSQSTIPYGTPAEIRAEVARLVTEMGAGGGYILAPAKFLMVETPTENAVACVEAFIDQPV